MVALGFAMAGLGLWALWLRWRDRLYEQRLIHWAAVAMAPSGFIAILCGWITTEVGRQPFTVYGLLTTAESVSPLDAPAVAASLLAFVVVYVVIFGAGIVYLLRLMARPPAAEHDVETSVEPNRAAGMTVATVLGQRPAGEGEGSS